ncbi:flagellar hook-basal body complex protein [bacterium]|nr:flagellar hook-basal body complex protein [bacterium]
MGNFAAPPYPPDGDPTAAVPDGIDDSGVELIDLSSGVIPDDQIDDTNVGTAPGLDNTVENFNGYQAFTPETTAFFSLFNQRGYGNASNFDGTAGVDRPTGVPVGVVAKHDDTSAFEMNAILQQGITRSTVNYQAVVPNDYRSTPTQNTGALIFDSTGRFVTYDDGTEPPTISFDPDATDPEFGGVSALSFKLDMSGITNFSAEHTAQLQSQDGRPIGLLDNVSISSTGDVMGIFTNGDTQTLGQILLANVTNEDGLLQSKNTMFTAGPNAGDRIFVEAGVEGGTISSGTLELSNVDLAQEFTNLIVAQRAYQANARVITTGDQILTEVVSLKR